MEGRCGKVERVYIGGGEGSEGGGWGWKGRGRGGEGGGEGGGGGGGGVWRYERSMNNARRNKTISLRIVNLTHCLAKHFARSASSPRQRSPSFCCFHSNFLVHGRAWEHVHVVLPTGS